MASRIKLLPENLINRIAAGEVVERPASILKEILENSLDAGATRIEVDIEAGGKKLIRVSDNGCGLNREELFLCLERHATSKLSVDSDLFAINTLGFRGEALPSIASVSKMTITSQQEEGPGHRLKVEGGKIVDLSPAPTNQGTIVEVRDIFYNVPARRKFLKTDATETAHLVEVAQRYALSRPNLRLRLKDQNREILCVDEHNDLTARAMRILGREAAASLKPFQIETGALKIWGLIAGPEAARGNSGLFVFVLGRPVRDRLINKAVIQGYGRTLPQGRFPSGVMFIELDPSLVDVNVHPAKTEVRFRDPGQIFNAISKAVAGTIDVSPVAEPQAPPVFEPIQGGPKAAAPDKNELSVGRSFGSSQPNRGWLPGFSMGRPRKDQRPVVSGPQPTPPWMDEKNEPTGSDQPDATLALRPLAQLCDSYILAQGPEGLYIIDQHAAHERIIFNSMKAELERTGLPSQGLLLPETMDLGPQESLAAMRLQARLERLGFRLEPFGGPTWTLRGIPATLEPKEAKEALVEILATAKKRLRDLDGAGLDSVVLELADTWLYSLSCRAAVKAGQRLDIREMESLIASMADTGSGGYCPHGRPSTIVLTLADLEKRFGRS